MCFPNNGSSKTKFQIEDAQRRIPISACERFRATQSPPLTVTSRSRRGLKKRSQALKRYRRSVYSFFSCFFVSTLIRNCQYFRADRILDRPASLSPLLWEPLVVSLRRAQQLYCLPIMDSRAKFIGTVRIFPTRTSSNMFIFHVRTVVTHAVYSFRRNIAE